MERSGWYLLRQDLQSYINCLKMSRSPEGKLNAIYPNLATKVSSPAYSGKTVEMRLSIRRLITGGKILLNRLNIIRETVNGLEFREIVTDMLQDEQRINVSSNVYHVVIQNNGYIEHRITHELIYGYTFSLYDVEIDNTLKMKAGSSTESYNLTVLENTKYPQLTVEIKRYTDRLTVDLVIKPSVSRTEVPDLIKYISNKLIITALIQSTNNIPELYTPEHFQILQKAFSKLTNSNRRITEQTLIGRPVSLTKRNLIDPHFPIEDLPGIEKVFRVSHKIDGYASKLYLMGKDAWLQIASTLRYFSSTATNRDSGLTILEGEVVASDRLIFYVYDVYSVDGKASKNKKHSVRLDKNLIDSIKVPNLTLVVKEFHTLRNFFETVRSVYNEVTPYPTDGLIFQKDVEIQNSVIYKWKPVELLTVDLLVGEYGELLNNQNEVVDYPYEGTLEPGKVYEMLYEDGTFRVIRERLDRSRPNSRAVIRENIELIKSPINIEDLTGDTLFLFSRQHNKFKRNAFSAIDGVGDVLFDIGAGKGSLIWEYSKFRVVIALDPNVDNLNELARRANSQNFETVFVDMDNPPPIVAGKTNVFIINGKLDAKVRAFVKQFRPNVITLFYVMQFMTKAELQILLNIINESANDLAIVGHQLDLKRVGSIESIDFGAAGEVIFEKGKAKLNYVSTTTVESGQVEDLIDVVKILNAVIKLSGRKGTLYTNVLVSDDWLVPDMQKLFNSMYTYFIWTSEGSKMGPYISSATPRSATNNPDQIFKTMLMLSNGDVLNELGVIDSQLQRVILSAIHHGYSRANMRDKTIKGKEFDTAVHHRTGIMLSHMTWGKLNRYIEKIADLIGFGLVFIMQGDTNQIKEYGESFAAKILILCDTTGFSLLVVDSEPPYTTIVPRYINVI